MGRLETLAFRATFTLVCLTALYVLGRTAYWLLDGAWVWIRPWATVLASSALLAGALAALRGRTWGVLLVAAAATSFAGAHACGIAPAWFVAVAAIGWLAVATTLRPLLRLDATALVVAVLVTLTLGTAAALLAGPGLVLLRGY
jgi:hypothetical protein